MRAVDYCIKKAAQMHKPVAINISFGNNFGSHAGNSLIETYLNDVAGTQQCVICVGSGNEGLGSTHADGMLESYQSEDIELIIQLYELKFGIQIWKSYYDAMDVVIQSPSGEIIARISEGDRIRNYSYKKMMIHCIYGEPSPFSMQQEIYIEFVAEEGYIPGGIWKLQLNAGVIKDGRYDMYLPSLISLNRGTQFAKASSLRTCTIPSTASEVISVGAYDAGINVIAPFSGRGYAGRLNGIAFAKPELAAPGVNVRLEDGHTVSGTSFATPYVTGRAAKLMEYGIVKKHDPYLYGAKLKAQLIREAIPLKYMDIPNAQAGWGIVCSGQTV